MEWESKVNQILAEHSARRTNGRIASERTQSLTRDVIFAAFRRLHNLGQKIQNPKNLGDRHIQILVSDWYLKGKKAKTIQNELSRLRQFCDWMGKPGMVGNIQKYLPEVDPKLLVVYSVAKTSKSWSAYGIDIVEKFREVDLSDYRLGLMLRLELGFGLRREEVLKCNPHLQDYGHYLKIFPGMGKGGRWRDIPIITHEQRELLEFVKARTSKTKPLGWEYSATGKPVTLQQNIRRYENLMASMGFTKKEAGVTGHGLRAQFAENQAMLMGLLPPTLNHSKGK